MMGDRAYTRHGYPPGASLVVSWMHMIGVFDSGVGGLAVLAEIRRRQPRYDILYLGDVAWAPYGTRSLRDVQTRCEKVTSKLAAMGSEIVVVACNTASAAALDHLRNTYPELRFVGMEPALKPAALQAPGGRVGILATEATFQSHLFSSVVERFGGTVEVVTAAAPGWVRLVEADVLEGEEAEREVARSLAELGDVDVLVLACTHFPALLPLIRRIAGESLEIIDPAPAVAAQAIRVASETLADGGGGNTRILSTDSLASLRRVADRLGLEAEFDVIGLT